MGTTPIRWARLRMLSVSMPASSASSTAARRTRSRLSRGRRGDSAEPSGDSWVSRAATVLLDMRTPYTYGRTRWCTPYAADRPSEGYATVKSSSKRQWWVPLGLVLLSLVPVLAGAARVGELTGGAQITAANARFFASPAPVVVHIIGASVYCLLGAFQFAPALRRRRRWHRTAGRLLVPFGLAAALSGLWMTLFYARPPADDVLLTPMRLVFGVAMAACLVLGLAAIRRRDITRHRAWMARGYAIGLGAGTQVLTHLPWILLGGTPAGPARVVLMLAGWLINLAVVEWALRRRPRRPLPAVVSSPEPIPAPCATGSRPR